MSDEQIVPADPREFTIRMFGRIHQLRRLAKGATSVDEIRGLVLLVLKEIVPDREEEHLLAATRAFVYDSPKGVMVDGTQLFGFCHPAAAAAYALAQVFAGASSDA